MTSCSCRGTQGPCGKCSRTGGVSNYSLYWRNAKELGLLFPKGSIALVFRCLHADLLENSAAASKSRMSSTATFQKHFAGGHGSIEAETCTPHILPDHFSLGDAWHQSAFRCFSSMTIPTQGDVRVLENQDQHE